MKHPFATIVTNDQKVVFFFTVNDQITDFVCHMPFGKDGPAFYLRSYNLFLQIRSNVLPYACHKGIIIGLFLRRHRRCVNVQSYVRDMKDVHFSTDSASDELSAL